MRRKRNEGKELRTWRDERKKTGINLDVERAVGEDEEVVEGVASGRTEEIDERQTSYRAVQC